MNIIEKNQRFYKVTQFVQGMDTIPPLTTDTIRWKNICFLDYSARYQSMVTFNMQEKTNEYQLTWDTLKNTIIVSNGTGNAHKDVFAYTKTDNEHLHLAGNWNGQSIAMELENIPIDSMTLVKDKFMFMQEDQ